MIEKNVNQTNFSWTWFRTGICDSPRRADATGSTNTI